MKQKGRGLTAANTVRVDRRYENLVQATLQHRVERGDVYWFIKAKPGDEDDTDGIDFFVHLTLESRGINLQVKGPNWRTNRRRIRNAERKKRAPHIERGYYRERGIRVIVLNRDATEESVWAFIWYLENHPDAWWLPTDAQLDWRVVGKSFLSLQRDGIIRSFEPVTDTCWRICDLSGRIREINRNEIIGRGVGEICSNLSPLLTTS